MATLVAAYFVLHHLNLSNLPLMPLSMFLLKLTISYCVGPWWVYYYLFTLKVCGPALCQSKWCCWQLNNPFECSCFSSLAASVGLPHFFYSNSIRNLVW